MNLIKPTLILFDVNETLLDMAPLKKNINTLLNDAQGFQVWFAMLLQYSLVDSCIKNYHDFSEIADATLEMAANSFKAEADAEQRKKALSVLTELPAYPDVAPALKLLKDKGFRLATLTNSPPATQDKQLQSAVLYNFFEARLSVDTLNIYKPALQTYEWAVKQLGAKKEETLLVAAHGWDVAGAIAAGLQTAFIKREGKSLYPLAPQPDYLGNDLMEIATIL